MNKLPLCDGFYVADEMWEGETNAGRDCRKVFKLPAAQKHVSITVTLLQWDTARCRMCEHICAIS